MSSESLEYQMSYAIYIAESEMYDNILLAGGYTLNESVDEVITEGVKETLLKYINKVTKSIQDVYTRFKNIVDEKEQKLMEKWKDAVAKAQDIHYNLEIFRQYDLGKFDNLKVPNVQDLQELRETAVDQATFCKTYFPMLDYDAADHNVGKAVENFLKGTLIKNKEVGEDFIKEQYAFLTEQYPKYSESIKADTESINNSNKAFQNMIQSMPDDAQTAVNNSAMVYVDTYLDIVTEKDDGEGNGKPVISDNTGQNAPSNATADEKKEFAKKNWVNVVSNYYQVSTKVMSTKMSILNKARINAKTVISYYISTLGKKGKEDNSNEPVPTEISEIT